MTRFQVTIDGVLVQQLFQRADVLAQLVQHVLNQVLQAQVTEQPQAAPYERSEGWQGYRNGYRERTLKTRIGMRTVERRDGVSSGSLLETRSLAVFREVFSLLA